MIYGENDQRGPDIMLFRITGLVLLSGTRLWLRHSLRSLRSNGRLYKALAERETDEVSQDFYQMLARKAQNRAGQKASRLFRLGVRIPADRDLLCARMWRQVVIFCGPNAVSAWVESGERWELTLTISVTRIVGGLAARQERKLHRTHSSPKQSKSGFPR